MKSFHSVRIVFLFLIALCFIGCSKEQTCNDTKSMEKAITKNLKDFISIDKNVTIFGTSDIDKIRFAGFTVDNKCGVGVFQKNSNDDFVFVHAYRQEKLTNRAIDTYVQHYSSGEKSYLIVISQNDKLAKISCISNIKVIDYNVASSPSITVIDETGLTQYEYKFYDYDGNLLP